MRLRDARDLSSHSQRRRGDNPTGGEASPDEVRGTADEPYRAGIIGDEIVTGPDGWRVVEDRLRDRVFLALAGEARRDRDDMAGNLAGGRVGFQEQFLA